MNPADTLIAQAETRTIWTPCPTCWGQRRIFENPNGEGLVPHTCPSCLGLGEQISASPGRRSGPHPGPTDARGPRNPRW